MMATSRDASNPLAGLNEIQNTGKALPPVIRVGSDMADLDHLGHSEMGRRHRHQPLIDEAAERWAKRQRAAMPDAQPSRARQHIHLGQIGGG